MALTKAQIETMDRITGINANPATEELSNDMFAEMDKITGLGGTTPELSLEEQIRNDNPEQYEQWKAKGPITPFEAALNASKEFNGTYENVVQRENYNPAEMNEFGKKVSSFVGKYAPVVKSGLKKVNNKLNNAYSTDKMFEEIDRQAAQKE